LKNRPKRIKAQTHHDDFPELTEEWFEGFKAELRERMKIKEPGYNSYWLDGYKALAKEILGE